MKELSLKGQRTVYRLTIVKGFNESEIENYANLVDIGKPGVNSVNFFASSLTMGQNKLDKVFFQALILFKTILE